MAKQMIFAIIASSKNSLINFRAPLLKHLAQYGAICCFSPSSTTHDFSLNDQLISAGFSQVDIPLKRRLFSPLSDIKCLLLIFKALQNHHQLTLIPYTLKPIFLTLLFLKVSKIILPKSYSPKFVPLITGMGSVFTNHSDSFAHYFLKPVFKIFLANVLSSCDLCIVQNKDDRSDLLNINPSIQSSKIQIVDGSGVDLNFFAQSLPPSVPVFLMIARIIPQKGVKHYLEAASILKARYSNVKFLLVGPMDATTPKSLRSLIVDLDQKSIINYMGATSDVNSFIRQCRYFVNPSFYREGIPRTSLEALSHGRPIISTATPGNSEVVLNNHNGFCIPSNSTPHLVKAMVSMLELTNTQYQTFASNSRLLAEKRFDALAVAKNTAQIILNA